MESRPSEVVYTDDIRSSRDVASHQDREAWMSCGRTCSDTIPPHELGSFGHTLTVNFDGDGEALIPLSDIVVEHLRHRHPEIAHNASDIIPRTVAITLYDSRKPIFVDLVDGNGRSVASTLHTEYENGTYMGKARLADEQSVELYVCVGPKTFDYSYYFGTKSGPLTPPPKVEVETDNGIVPMHAISLSSTDECAPPWITALSRKLDREEPLEFYPSQSVVVSVYAKKKSLESDYMFIQPDVVHSVMEAMRVFYPDCNALSGVYLKFKGAIPRSRAKVYLEADDMTILAYHDDICESASDGKRCAHGHVDRSQNKAIDTSKHLVVPYNTQSVPFLGVKKAGVSELFEVHYNLCPGGETVCEAPGVESDTGDSDDESDGDGSDATSKDSDEEAEGGATSKDSDEDEDDGATSKDDGEEEDDGTTSKDSDEEEDDGATSKDGGEEEEDSATSKDGGEEEEDSATSKDGGEEEEDSATSKDSDEEEEDSATSKDSDEYDGSSSGTLVSSGTSDGGTTESDKSVYISEDDEDMSDDATSITDATSYASD